MAGSFALVAFSLLESCMMGCFDMRDGTQNTVDVKSVLQRPEWGDDGEVHINLEVGSDYLYVEIRYWFTRLAPILMTRS